MIEQIIDFSTNHLLLVTATVIAALLLIQNLLADNKDNISAIQATEMINHKNAVVIDVRPAKDFAQGHIIGAINIPAAHLKNQMTQLEKYKNDIIIINCRSGAQSSIACKQLHKDGFESVYNLSGGILGWQSENLPITTNK